MRLSKTEYSFIKEKIPNGEVLLGERNWDKVLSSLDYLELEIGYVNNDPNNQPLNDTGRFIEKLIDKIAYDDGDDAILEITQS